MKLSQKAQHTLEYMILLTLIMAGIIIGGPYAIRSWNAHIKSWEDSTLDSFNDPLQEAPAGLVELEGCNPTAWTASGCGLITPPLDPCTATPRALDNPPSEDSSTWTYKSACAPGERLYTRTFNPNGCQCNFPPPTPTEPIAKCEVDSCCCNLRPLDVCVAENNGLNGAAVPDCANTPNSRPLNPDGSCNNGYMKWAGTCGADPTTRYICVWDPACVLECTPPPSPQINTGAYDWPCADYNTNLPRRGIHYRYVNLGACDPNQKCQIQCKSGFEPSADGTECICPNGCTVTGTVDNPICYCCPGRGCEPGEAETDPVSGGTCSSRCPQDCGHCIPNCCGPGCPDDEAGVRSPAWDQRTLNFMAEFIWSGGPLSWPYVRSVDGTSTVNTGDRIAYYFRHRGDNYYCSYNITTGRWLNETKYGSESPIISGIQYPDDSYCRSVVFGHETGVLSCYELGAPTRICQNLNGGWGCFPICGNQWCDSNENCSSCPGDCSCPANTHCSGGSCVANQCGDGICQTSSPSNENCNNCAPDCGCGTFTCRGTLRFGVMTYACDPGCGNNICETSGFPAENCNTCSQDCGCQAPSQCLRGGFIGPLTYSCTVSNPRCGDGVCSPAFGAGETCSTCAQDCGCPAGQRCTPGNFITPGGCQ